MAKGFKHGAGGGSSLNFKVVGNPMPSTAKENTIWVDTDKINNYYFSATQPENMAEYDVWFRIGTSSAAAFSATKKNPVMIYPIAAKQYISGVLVSKNAKIYQSGEWAEFATYFYLNGDECTSNGGVWTNSGYSRSGFTLAAPTKTDSYMLVKGNGSGTVNGFAGKEKTINLTDIDSITAIVENVAGESGYMLVMSSKSFSAPTNAAAYVMISIEQTKQTVTLDVSELTGNYYLAFMTGVSNKNGFKILEVLT